MDSFTSVFEDIMSNIRSLNRRISRFETWEPSSNITISTDDTANPPTDAELDTAFGTPAVVGSGFVGLLDDNGADSNVYLCISNGTSWWYATLTKAV